MASSSYHEADLLRATYQAITPLLNSHFSHLLEEKPLGFDPSMGLSTFYVLLYT